MADSRSVLVTLIANVGQYKAEMAAAAASTSAVGNAAVGASAKSSAGFAKLSKASMLVGVGVLAAGVASVKMAGDFQESMTQLVTGAGEAESSIKLVADGILKMAPEVGQSPKDLADGMYMISSAGIHGAQGLEVLRVAAEGAKVGASDLGDTADALTTGLNAWQLPATSATSVMNQLVETMANGKTHMQNLVSTLGTIAPMAAALHIPLSQVGGAMATLTGQGTNAAKASTALRFMLGALVKPTDKATEVLDKAGLSSTRLNEVIGSQGLGQGLTLLQTKLHAAFGNGPEYVAALASVVGGTRGMTAALELTGPHLETYKNNIDKVAEAGQKAGADVEGWANVQHDLNQKLDQLGAKAQVAGINLGNALLPTAISVVDVLGSMAGYLAENTGVAKGLLAVLGAFAAVKVVSVFWGIGKSAIEMGSALLSGVARITGLTAALEAHTIAAGVDTAATRTNTAAQAGSGAGVGKGAGVGAAGALNAVAAAAAVATAVNFALDRVTQLVAMEQESSNGFVALAGKASAAGLEIGKVFLGAGMRDQIEVLKNGINTAIFGFQQLEGTLADTGIQTSDIQARMAQLVAADDINQITGQFAYFADAGHASADQLKALAESIPGLNGYLDSLGLAVDGTTGKIGQSAAALKAQQEALSSALAQASAGFAGQSIHAQEYARAVVEAGRAAGQTDQQITAMLASIGATPHQIAIAIRANPAQLDAALAKAQTDLNSLKQYRRPDIVASVSKLQSQLTAAQERVDSLKQNKKPSIAAIDKATAIVNAIQSAISAIQGKTVTITTLWKNIHQSIGWNEAPARAWGGPVRGQYPYLVGESGPELFMPGATGFITPARQTRDYLARGGLIAGAFKKGGAVAAAKAAAEVKATPAAANAAIAAGGKAAKIYTKAHPKSAAAAVRRAAAGAASSAESSFEEAQSSLESTQTSADSAQSEAERAAEALASARKSVADAFKAAASITGFSLTQHASDLDAVVAAQNNLISSSDALAIARGKVNTASRADRPEAIRALAEANLKYATATTALATAKDKEAKSKVTPENILGSMRSRLGMMQGFIGNLGTLKARGLHPTILSDIIASGLVDGSAMAAALVGAGDLTGFNAAQQAINDTSAQIGVFSTDITIGPSPEPAPAPAPAPVPSPSPSHGGKGGPSRRAQGGPVQAGRAYLVGEQGIETFIPAQSGTIVPAANYRGAAMDNRTHTAQITVKGPGRSTADDWNMFVDYHLTTGFTARGAHIFQ